MRDSWSDTVLVQLLSLQSLIDREHKCSGQADQKDPVDGLQSGQYSAVRIYGYVSIPQGGEGHERKVDGLLETFEFLN